MSALTQDLRYALRTFLNSPGSTAVAILVLSLGIGANAAIFSVTSAVLFRALPYKDSGSLVFVWESNPSKAMLDCGGFPQRTIGNITTRNQALDGWQPCASNPRC